HIILRHASYPTPVDHISFPLSSFFFFNHTATTELYTLSLHDALPISGGAASSLYPGIAAIHACCGFSRQSPEPDRRHGADPDRTDRKSTRLNSSHVKISYAVFCLKKKNNDTR